MGQEEEEEKDIVYCEKCKGETFTVWMKIPFNYELFGQCTKCKHVQSLYTG